MKLNGSDYDLTTAVWHKSSYSGGSGGNCLEVLDGLPEASPSATPRWLTAPR